MTGFSTQISILDAHEDLPNSKGNIFIIDDHPANVAPKLDWITNDKLRIIRKLTGSEHKAEASFGWFKKVSVEYESSR